MPPAASRLFDARVLRAQSRKLGLRLVILFGSRAGGRPAPGPDSDIDVAVLDSKPDRGGRLWRIIHSLSKAFGGKNLDVAILNEADPLFRHEVMRRAVLLYGDPMEHLRYRAYAWRSYRDSRDLLRLEGVLLRKKLAWLGERLHAAA